MNPENPKPKLPTGWSKGQLLGSSEEEEQVNRPRHYIAGGIETIDFIEAKQLGYHLGNVVKYISRAGIKSHDPLVDIRKAKWYLDRYLEVLEQEAGFR